MPDIFLSYSKGDRLYSRAVKHWLVNSDLDSRAFTYETDMEIGEWERDLRKKILNADLVVFFYSENWKQSPNCLQELFLAREHEIPAVALLVPGSKSSDVKDHWLSGKQHYPISPDDSSDTSKVEPISFLLNGK